MLHCQRIAKRTGLQHFCQHQRPRQPLLARSTSLVVSEVDKRYTRKLVGAKQGFGLLDLDPGRASGYTTFPNDEQLHPLG
jgi:hypothetical protein